MCSGRRSDADARAARAGAMEAALTAAIEQAREEGQPVDEIAQAAAQGAEITTEIIDTEDGRHEIIITAEDDPEDDPIPETMTVHYDVPGSARKALPNGPTRRGRKRCWSM